MRFNHKTHRLGMAEGTVEEVNSHLYTLSRDGNADIEILDTQFHVLTEGRRGPIVRMYVSYIKHVKPDTEPLEVPEEVEMPDLVVVESDHSEPVGLFGLIGKGIRWLYTGKENVNG